MYRLTDLLEKLDYEVVRGSLDTMVTEVVNDSRKVTPGSLFICITGYASDGHVYANEVAGKGASVLVVEKDVDLFELGKINSDITVIKVKDTRYAMAFISAAYFGHPADKLKVIGITGTKGKTTSTFIVKSILEKAGYKVGLIGSIGAVFNDKFIPTKNTTPESFELQRIFAEMVKDGVSIVVIEVASQGLKLHRTQGFTFELGIFTNLSNDHIGPNEHATFEEYMECKGLLFRQCRHGIVNADDPYTLGVIKNHTCDIITYGFNKDADLYAENLELIKTPGNLGIAFDVRGQIDFRAEVNTPGKFSVYNALTAIAICNYFDVDQNIIIEALKDIHVKGRIEMVNTPYPFTLLIDYAHNAVSLESILTTLREYSPNRLICLFGCGGNRSKDRRYSMGEVSGKLSDITIITSDNPRDEDPQEIINDIKIGMEKTMGKYVEIIDRKDAIRYAMSIGKPNDIIVLSGKGNEDYQEIKGVRYQMDERVLIKEILEEE